MTHMQWTIHIGVGKSDKEFPALRVGVNFENLGFFPLALPFLFDLLQKFHKGFWIGLWTIKGFVNVY